MLPYLYITLDTECYSTVLLIGLERDTGYWMNGSWIFCLDAIRRLDSYKHNTLRILKHDASLWTWSLFDREFLKLDTSLWTWLPGGRQKISKTRFITLHLVTHCSTENF